MAKELSNSAKRRKVEETIKKATTDKDYAKIIYSIKYKVNVQQWHILLDKLDTRKREKILGDPLPLSLKEYRKVNTYFSVDYLHLEILWLLNIMNSYSEQINTFLEYKKKFEVSLLKGEYELAREILQKIDSEVCISNWSIEQEFFISELEHGFKKNKEYLSKLIDKDPDPLNTVLFKYQSIKAEKNLSAHKYHKTIYDYSLKYGSILIREYLIFKLDFFAKNNYSAKGFLLSMENNASIIDRYEMLLLIFSIIISDNAEDLKLKELVGTASFSLLDKIKDKRLQNLSLVCNKPVLISMEEEDGDFIKVLDLYSKGEYNNTISYVESILEKYPYNIDLYKIYVKSIIIQNIECKSLFTNSSIASRILKSIYNIYSKNYEVISSLADLHKLVISSNVTSWTSDLNSLLIDENSLYEPSYNHYLFNDLQSPCLNPKILHHIDPKQNKIIYQEYNKIGKDLNSATFNFLYSYINGLDDCSEVHSFRRILYNAEYLCKNGQEKEALVLFDSLVTQKEFNYFCMLPFYSERIVQGRVKCFMNQKVYCKAISIIVEACIQNENFVSKFKTEELINFAINNEDLYIASDISIPIYLYLNNQLGGSLWAAYDNFLVTNNLTFPEEIESKLSELNKELIIFFLDRVCVKEVYDSSYLYENQNDLDNQRIEICLLLTRIDKANFSKYIEEISSIDRDILIRKGIQQIDESKIYADTKGIKNSLGSELRESFNRYIELDTIPLEQLNKIASDIDDVYILFLEKKLDEVIDSNLGEVNLTSYNRFAYFAEMFYKIRDEFISSNDYGLETYLSMRIRHGTLLGIIRSVFETRHLITKKDPNKEEYNVNHYWFDKIITNSDGLVQDKFNNILSSFSSSIDNISDELKNKWLQMNIETKESEGLFNYNYNEGSTLLQLFQEKIGKISDYNEFVDAVIKELWNRTEENLKSIRKFISEDIRTDMINKLLKLQSDLNELKNEHSNLDIVEIIREITSCKTAITQELNTISEWFKRTNNKTINDFDIKLPIDACLTTLKRIESNFPSLYPTIKVHSTTRFDGAHLTHFSDIMHIIIGNIIKHSYLNASQLDVCIDVEEKNSKILSISVSNKISKNLDLEKINKKIENTKKLLEQKVSIDKTRGEEGSGYLKLKKIITSDLERDEYKIELNPVLKDYIFRTKVEFYISGLEKKAL